MWRLPLLGLLGPLRLGPLTAGSLTAAAQPEQPAAADEGDPGFWTTYGATARYDSASNRVPPKQAPAHFHPCIPALRRHCADSEAVSHQDCLAALPPEAGCSPQHVARYRGQNCAQWADLDGLLPVTKFGGLGDGAADNIEAIERAVNATRICGGSVGFPTGRYMVSRTIELARDDDFGGSAVFIGVGVAPFDTRFDGAAYVAYNTGPTALIYSKQPKGPVVRIGEHNVSGGANDGGSYGCGGNVFFQNMGFSGYECGVHILNSAWVRFRNTGVKAAVYTGGDSNAAMVLENSFWQWFEEGTAFEFRCDGQSDCLGKPSVIMRGNNETFAFVRTVYAFKFDRVHTIPPEDVSSPTLYIAYR
eukprot:SAG22_NODE_1001_length_6086_cov_3.870887_5_plen_361_part_00